MLSLLWAHVLTTTLFASPATVAVEIVSQPVELQRGLQGHKPLVEGTGMLFILPQAETARFWMKEMTFAIDILFLQADGTVANVALKAPPCKQAVCPVYQSNGPVTHVLEVPAGWSERHAVSAGTRLRINVAEHVVSTASPVQ